MATYYSNPPFGTPYQSPPTGSLDDHGPGNISSMAGEEGSPTSDAHAAISPSAEAYVPRKCSVRGCVAIMPAETTNKMCEACRGRHRVYAMTKRAKRKMEKEALNQQGVALLSNEQPPGTVWLPENPEVEDDDAGSWVRRPDTTPGQSAEVSLTFETAWRVNFSKLLERASPKFPFRTGLAPHRLRISLPGLLPGITLYSTLGLSLAKVLSWQVH